MRCWIIGLEERIEGANSGLDGTVVDRRGGNPMDETMEKLATYTRISLRLPELKSSEEGPSYLFGFFGALPSNGFSYLAWTTVTSPVFGSLSKDVAVIGNGAFKRPTDFPGARRK